MQMIFTARSKEDDTIAYIPLMQHGLTAETNQLGGGGLAGDPLRVEVKIGNPGHNVWEGVIQIALTFPMVEPRFFLPGFMYGRNRGEAPMNVANEFPRMREDKTHRPASSWWMVRSDRLSHPAAFVFDSKRVYGLSARPYFTRENGEFYQYSGFTCSLRDGSIGYTLGYENAPWMFVQSHKVKERKPLGENCFLLLPGEEVRFEVNLYDYESEDERGIHKAIQHVYEAYHQSPRKAACARQAVTDIGNAVMRDGWIEDKMNYSGIVYEKPDGGLEYNEIFSISWTNGLSVAVPMLMTALRLDREDMRGQALMCIENIVDNSLNPASGLPYETYDGTRWSNRGWWFDGMHTPGHASYLIGQAAYYLLKAYDYELNIKNYRHGSWLDFVYQVLCKMETTKNSDQEYPYILSELTGAGVEYDSMAGVWCLAALAYYNCLTGETAFLPGMRASEKHYYEKFVKRSECYGAPLDTDKTIDSEGILAYIRAVRWMHVLTGEDIYLEHLKDGLCYEYTFKFCYNSPVKVEPLNKIGWSSCGGSITSVANPHIHPMSSTIADEMLYYIRQNPDPYIESRLKDTIGWSCQTFNRFDKEYDYGRKGWMSERFCHCEGLLVQEYPDGEKAGTWFALMPWACGSILEGLSGECWNVVL